VSSSTSMILIQSFKKMHPVIWKSQEVRQTLGHDDTWKYTTFSKLQLTHFSFISQNLIKWSYSVSCLCQLQYFKLILLPIKCHSDEILKKAQKDRILTAVNINNMVLWVVTQCSACSMGTKILDLLNETNGMRIYCTFFRVMHLNVSVLSDHPQRAHCYRVCQCYHVQSPVYKYLQYCDVNPEHHIIYQKWRLKN
jgi:hypothetical protein